MNRLFLFILISLAACGGSDTAGTTTPDLCSEDVYYCPGGSVLNRDPAEECQFPVCEE